MSYRSSVRHFALLLAVCCILQMPAAHAQLMAIVERYPSGSIRSEELADQALKDIEAERRAVDARYTESERACFDKFFATSCMQKAKDQRRDALTRMRPIEIEAHTFKRRLRADAHAAAAAERAEKREAMVNEHAQAASMPPTSGDSGTK